MADLLEGIRVMDFTHVHAGPLCTYQLALMGAEVIRVEPIEVGDQMRSMGVQLEPGISPGFLGQNADKRSLAIDLKSAEGLAIVRKLAKTADVAVINMRPGTPERLQIDFESIRALKPNIVYCQISGYGRSGPESDRPAFDHLVQGESGMFMATGLVNQPVRVGFAVVDAGTALVASSAINAALLKRERTGEGSFLDVSMLESAMTLMGLNFYSYLATGRVGPRVGPNPLATRGSAGTFLTLDKKYLMVNANSHRLFERLAKAVDRSELTVDERFNSPRAAHKNGPVLRQIFADLFATNTADYWDRLLREAGVPVGQAKTPGEVLANPQFEYRQSLTRLDGVPGMADGLTVLNAGFTVDETPTAPSEPPPRLGQHSAELLLELGYEQSAIAELRARNIVQ